LALCHRSTCTTTSLSLSLCTSRPPTIHSFPTRRSSDLALVLRALAPCHRQREPDQGQHHHDDDDQHDDLGCGHAPGFPPPPPGQTVQVGTHSGVPSGGAARRLSDEIAGPTRSAGPAIAWRWRRDLNPRWACTHKRFRGVLLRPLGHATAGNVTRTRAGRPNRGPAVRGQRRWAKKSTSSAADSSPRTPATTSGRWCSRRSRTTSQREPTAPALSSYAPKTRRATRDWTSAPAHMVHGSRVTTRVWPSRRHSPRTRAAARSAWISAWPLGS